MEAGAGRNPAKRGMRYGGRPVSADWRIVLNTAGYKYGFLQPHPALAILRRYYALGGRLLTIGADAHRPEHIAFAFDRTEAALRSVGFTGYCIFESRRMQEIPF